MNRRSGWAFALSAVLLLLASVFTILHLPEAGEHSISLSTVGPEVRGVSVGETTEFVIQVKNTGVSTQQIYLSVEGAHNGWRWVLYPDKLTVQPGKNALTVLEVSLFSADAEPFADYTVIGRSGGNVSAVTVFAYVNGTVEIMENGSWKKAALGEVKNWQAIRTGNSSLVQLGFSTMNGDPGAAIVLLSNSHLELDGLSGGNSTHPITDIHLTLKNGSVVLYVAERAQLNLTIKTTDAQIICHATPFLAKVDTGTNGTVTTLSVYQGVGVFQGHTRGEEMVEIGESLSSEGVRKHLSFNLIIVDCGVYQGVRPVVRQGNSIYGWDADWVPINSDGRGFSLFIGGKAIFVTEAGACVTTIQGVRSGKYTFDGMQFLRANATAHEFTRYRISNMTYNSITTDTIQMDEGITLKVKEGTRRGYDFRIAYFSTPDTNTWLEIKGIPISNPERHRFSPLDRRELSNPERYSLRFQMDRDGNGVFEKSVKVKHGMTWQEIEEKLNKADEEKVSIIPILVSAVIIFLVVISVGLFTLREKRRREEEGTPRVKKEVKMPGKSEEVKMPGESEEVKMPGESEEVKMPGESEEIKMPGESEEVKMPEESEEVKGSEVTAEMERIEDMEELPDEIFPLSIKCPGCSAPVRISDAGEYRCTICHCLFDVDLEGNVKEVKGENHADFPIVVKCPECAFSLKILRCGRVRCPECGSILAVDIEGSVKKAE